MPDTPKVGKSDWGAVYDAAKSAGAKAASMAMDVIDKRFPDGIPDDLGTKVLDDNDLVLMAAFARMPGSAATQGLDEVCMLPIDPDDGRIYTAISVAKEALIHSYRTNLASALHMAKGKPYVTDWRKKDGIDHCGCSACRTNSKDAKGHAVMCTCPRCSLISLGGKPVDGRYDGLGIYGNLTGSVCSDGESLAELIEAALPVPDDMDDLAYVPIWQAFDRPPPRGAIGTQDVMCDALRRMLENMGINDLLPDDDDTDEDS